MPFWMRGNDRQSEIGHPNEITSLVETTVRHAGQEKDTLSPCHTLSILKIEVVRKCQIRSRLSSAGDRWNVLLDSCKIRGHYMFGHILNTEVLQIIPERKHG